MTFLKNFFHLPDDLWIIPIRLHHLIIAFAIYFFGTFLSSSFFVHVLGRQSFANTLSLLSWFNFATSSFILLLLILYFLFLPQTVRNLIGWHSFSWNDPKAAITAFILAFPTVLIVNQILEAITLTIFNLKELPDQIAVHFLKSTFDQPSHFLLAVISISIYAPLIEETLFRGFLQTFIRKHLGSKQAILITSVCFSLFHFSSSQSYGNIPIIGSLFLLALFLGFLYEKQRTLLAPMILHSLFNTVSVLSLYLFGGFTTAI